MFKTLNIWPAYIYIKYLFILPTEFLGNLRRKLLPIFSKRCHFLLGFSVKVLNNETVEVVPPFFLCLVQRSLTYARALTQIDIMSQKIIPKGLAIQDILLCQRGPIFVNSLLLNATSVNMRDNMASLQWFYHHQSD